jgi:transposase InsO family protein
VSERFEFVRRLEEGERVVDLCHEFGISRKTAYKLKERFEQMGPRGLFDRSRAPRTIPHRTPPEVEELLVGARKDHPTWGPKKIRASLLRKNPELHLPCTSTVGDVLKRHGLIVTRKRRRSTAPYGSPLLTATAPNHIWCADFKGQFRLGTGRHCYPLTITDRFSRFLIRCEGLEGTHVETAIVVFDLAFREFGMPVVIRTDNGCPFAAPGLWGLSKLTARWLRLGIWPERIEPAHPEQNGQHERMHLVLKQETTRPAGDNLLQ